MSNEFLSSKKFAHHVLLLFFPSRDEKQLSGCPPLYQNQLQKQRVQDVVNRSKKKFESYGDLVELVFSQFNESYINNQDSHNQIENDKTPGAEYPNEKYLEDTETSKTSAIPNFMPKILPDDEIAKDVNFLMQSKEKSSMWLIHGLKIM